MATVGAFEAKTRLSELLERARGGERILITKRGEPIAVLGPLPEEPRLSPSEAGQRLLQLRATLPKTKLALRQLRDEGRRR